jgi:hypothetical protein
MFRTSGRFEVAQGARRIRRGGVPPAVDALRRQPPAHRLIQARILPGPVHEGRDHFVAVAHFEARIKRTGMCAALDKHRAA